MCYFSNTELSIYALKNIPSFVKFNIIVIISRKLCISRIHKHQTRHRYKTYTNVQLSIGARVTWPEKSKIKSRGRVQQPKRLKRHCAYTHPDKYTHSNKTPLSHDSIEFENGGEKPVADWPAVRGWRNQRPTMQSPEIVWRTS
jgi:hypothetical protein